MRNPVLLRIDVGGEDQPLSNVSLIATFTLTASHLNEEAVVLIAADDGEILIPPGAQYRFERVDLSQIQVRSQGEEAALFVVGQAG
jgi:hypothetical protein